jgi:hypothetical protein
MCFRRFDFWETAHLAGNKVRQGSNFLMETQNAPSMPERR